jgi:hypothetical protein
MLPTAACLTEISIYFIIRRSWAKKVGACATVNSGIHQGGYAYEFGRNRKREAGSTAGS